MSDDVIEIEDYEVKEKLELIDDDNNDNDYNGDYSKGTARDYSSSSTATGYTASIGGNALIIIGLVAILLVAIFVLTIC